MITTFVFVSLFFLELALFFFPCPKFDNDELEAVSSDSTFTFFIPGSRSFFTFTRFRAFALLSAAC